jgi:regulator of nonsense transcripts 2
MASAAIAWHNARSPCSTRVQVMMRLRAAKRLDERQSLLIQHAFYQCRPAARPQSRRKPRSPLQLYMRHLVCDLLAEDSIQQVSRR